MLVNLSDIFISEGKSEQGIYLFEADTIVNGQERFPIVEKSEIQMCTTHTGKGRAKVEFSMKLLLDMTCNRCLEQVLVPIKIDSWREVFSPDVKVDEDDTEDNLTVMESYSLNVETLVFNEILMNWPEKVLCRQDCKGICRVCGQNLNDRDCDCDTFVPDPRMAVIKDIFNANKEV